MKKILAVLISLVSFQGAHAQWTIRNSPNLPNSFIYQVEAIDANTAWGASPFMEVVKTTDGGITWNSYPIVDPVFTSANVTSVSALNADTAWIVVAEMGQTYFSRIYRTTNGGTTWQHQASAYPNPGSYGYNIHFFDANNGVALGFKVIQGQSSLIEIITTSNGGITWNAVPAANMPAMPASDPAYNTLTTIGNTIWIMDLDLNILKSADKGLTWTSTNPGFTQGPGSMETSLAFSDANNGLAGFNGQLKRTIDGGATWTTVAPAGTLFPFRIIPIPGTSLYMSSSRDAGNAGSSISYDNGNTWIQLENTYRHFDMEFVNATTGYSGGFNQMQVFRGSLLGKGEDILAWNNNFPISPNPTTGVFTISNTSAQAFRLEVYNLTGAKVLQQKGRLLGPTRIDLTGQPAGMYIVRIFSNGQVVNRKLLVL